MSEVNKRRFWEMLLYLCRFVSLNSALVFAQGNAAIKEVLEGLASKLKDQAAYTAAYEAVRSAIFR